MIVTFRQRIKERKVNFGGCVFTFGSHITVSRDLQSVRSRCSKFGQSIWRPCKLLDTLKVRTFTEGCWTNKFPVSSKEKEGNRWHILTVTIRWKTLKNCESLQPRNSRHRWQWKTSRLWQFWTKSLTAEVVIREQYETLTNFKHLQFKDNCLRTSSFKRQQPSTW
jgi:hypothetical protein